MTTLASTESERLPVKSQLSKTPPRLIRLTEVVTITGLSRSGVYLRMDQNEFPRSVSLGGNAVGWVESEVRMWVESRISEREVGRSAE